MSTVYEHREPPIGEPMFDATFWQATKRFFRGYVTFTGRASRAEFWWAYLMVNLLTLIPVIIYTVGVFITVTVHVSTAAAGQLPGDANALSVVLSALVWAIPLLVVSLGTILPMLALTWRRLHDAGFAGPLALLHFVVNIVPLILCIMPTSPKALQYGPGAVPADPNQYPQQAPYGHPGQQPPYRQ